MKQISSVGDERTEVRIFKSAVENLKEGRKYHREINNYGVALKGGAGLCAILFKGHNL